MLLTSSLRLSALETPCLTRYTSLTVVVITSGILIQPRSNTEREILTFLPTLLLQPCVPVKEILTFLLGLGKLTINHAINR